MDHRTIEYVIFKNVKYTLGKSCSEQIPLKHDSSKAKWDSKNLAVGNMFSQTQYYKVTKVIDTDKVEVKTRDEAGKTLVLSRDILEQEMRCASIFGSTEKVTRTEMLEKMESAKETCFQAVFNKKVTAEHVK